MSAREAYIVAALFVHGVDADSKMIHGPATGVTISPPKLPAPGVAKMLLVVGAGAGGVYQVKISVRPPAGPTRPVATVGVRIDKSQRGMPERSWLGIQPVQIVFDVREWGLHWFDVQLAEQNTSVPFLVEPGE